MQLSYPRLKFTATRPSPAFSHYYPSASMHNGTGESWGWRSAKSRALREAMSPGMKDVVWDIETRIQRLLPATE
ncbi:hypothetical protein DIPPA_23288 [Diplonema papillatum]|nr:hypothetical protein DIPPA_23288 [Diplonema papillatum]